jgi:hypothetical protein
VDLCDVSSDWLDSLSIGELLTWRYPLVREILSQPAARQIHRAEFIRR